MAVDFTVDDPEIYVETEKEYSKQDMLYKIVEWERCCAGSRIESLQKGLIPRLLQFNWRKSDTYFKNGKYAISRRCLETCLNIWGLENKFLVNENLNRFFCENMKNAHENNLVQPFLLFINGIHILWSRIIIVRSDSNISLLISNMNRNIEITSINIISLPFSVIYTEGEDEDPNRSVLYRFDKDGYYSYKSYVFVYAKNKSTNTNVYDGNLFINYDMNLDFNIYLTSDNFTIFDSTGKLVTDYTPTIKNTNLLTINNLNTKHFVLCHYSKNSNDNQAYVNKIRNKEYIKELLLNSNVIDTTTVKTNFDFEHSKESNYLTNITNSLDYIFEYDKNKLDSIFESVKNINIFQYDINDMIHRKNISTNGFITMLRDIYEGDNNEVFPIIFHNGIIPNYYSSITYTSNTFTFKPPSISTTDTFEIAYFKNVNNTLIKLDITHKDNLDYLDLESFYIPKEDIVVYSSCRGEDNLFPINYTIDSTNHIVLSNLNYLEGQLYIGSKNQFIHHNFSPTTNTSIIDLPSKFRTAYNSNKYMVFVNGRLLNNIYYRILIPTMNNKKITKRSIYTRKTFTPSDRIDIFYCANTPTNRIDLNGDLQIYCIKVQAIQNNQTVFKVPYPFPNYPKIKDAFYCIKNSVYVDKSKYILTGDNIEFIENDSPFKIETDLVFVFPYNTNIYNIQSEIDGLLNFVSRSVRTTEETNTIIFPTNIDSYGDFNTNSVLYTFIGTTYVNPERYTITSNNTIRFTNETIPEDTLVTVSVETEYNNISNSQLHLRYSKLTATTNGQTEFTIPLPDYAESMMVFKGSVLLHPDAYLYGESTLVILNTFDALNQGDNLFVVYVINNTSTYIKTDHVMYTPTTNCTSFTIPLPNRLNNVTLNKSNTLLFTGSTFIPPARYTLANNIVTLVNSDDIFNTNCTVTIMVAYIPKITITDSRGLLSPQDIFYFQSIDVAISTNGQNTFNIPWPYPQFKKDTPFFLTIGSTFINPDMYTETDTQIILNDASSSIIGRHLTFVFVHNKGFTHVSKSVINVTVTPGQTEINIPSPFSELIDLENRMILSYGSLYIDKERYTIDSINKKINIIDLPIPITRKVTFTFFYVGNNEIGEIIYLPQSGYIYISKNKASLKYNANKEMYMAFVNGKKIPKSYLLDITNNIIKVTKDIQSQHDLVMINYSPIITELKDRYSTFSKWDNFVNQFPI